MEEYTNRRGFKLGGKEPNSGSTGGNKENEAGGGQMFPGKRRDKDSEAEGRKEHWERRVGRGLLVRR